MEISTNPTDGTTVTQTTQGRAIVLTPPGSLTYETCDALLAGLDQAYKTARPLVVIDCRQVSAVDSAALELLKKWHKSFEDSNGALRLANLNEVCADILMVTRLSHVLAVYESVEEAVQSE
jgi:anti-anti-sigma factor